MNSINFDVVYSLGLMNSITGGCHMFFDKSLGCFVVSENNEPPVWCADHDIIMCPYAIADRGTTWKKFYEIISDDERKLINDFKGGMGFFEFLRETGIINTHDEAEQLVIEDNFRAWVVVNDITIDWDNVVVL